LTLFIEVTSYSVVVRFSALAIYFFRYRLQNKYGFHSLL